MKYTATVVTALFDIKRGKLTGKEARSIETYLTWFKNVLTLQAPMVIYIEPMYKDFILEHRKPMLEYTRIVETPISALENSELNARVQAIIKKADFKNDRHRLDRPELNLSLYNTICYNKINWLVEEINRPTFPCKYFIWMDAGYMHGSPMIKKFTDRIWPDPVSVKVLDDNRIHILCIRPVTPDLLKDETGRFLKHRIFHSGGAFAGTAQAISTYAIKYGNVLDKLLEREIMDDDQSVITSVYVRYPELFSNVGPTYGNYFEFLNYLGPYGRIRCNYKGYIQHKLRKLFALEM